MTKEDFKPFRCCECSNLVSLCKFHNRKYSIFYRHEMIIPYDLELPTCENCGDFFITPTEEKIIHEVLSMQLALEIELNIQTIISKHSITVKDLEYACCVSYNYFKNIKNHINNEDSKIAQIIQMLKMFLHVPGALEFCLKKK